MGSSDGIKEEVNVNKIPVLANRQEEFESFLYRQHKSCRACYYYAHSAKDLQARTFETFIILEGFWATPNPNADELYELAGHIAARNQNDSAT